MKPIKITIILHSSQMGGAERSVLELIDALKGRQVEFYAILPNNGPLLNEFDNRQITYSIYPYRWWMDARPCWKRLALTLWNFLMVIPIAAKIRQWRCDVVLTNTMVVGVGALAAKLLRRPHVWYIREFAQEGLGVEFHLGPKISFWLMDKLAAVCIVNSGAVAQYYQEFIPQSKLKVIYPSVSLTSSSRFENFSPRANTGMRCIMVGSIYEAKRQEDAIRAIAELVYRGMRVDLTIVGGSYREYQMFLENLVKDHGLMKHVKFTGYVEDPFPLIQNSDVLLVCSRSEGFGRVTVEAMMAGKPVIGTKSGGTTELIREGFNGFLYTPLNHLELAEKIAYFYQHPEVRQEMGNNARQWSSERFNQDRFGEEMLALLRQVIE
jgi:glycosyltransferase involved in cell wall biosynthesis